MRKLALLVVAAAVFAGCSGGEDRIAATARFGDVGDLAKEAPVMMADIVIGEVTGIRLVSNEALVSFEVEESAGVPVDVEARVRRTSVLGERIIDLVPGEDVTNDSPLLADGDQITNTVTRSDLEDLVAEGSDVLGAISASELAIMIEEGGEGFGGQGLELRRLLDNYNEILTAYSGRSKMIVRLIESVNRFNTTLAPRAKAHQKAMANAAKNFRMLAEEGERLGAAITSLARLARGGRVILDEHVDEMTNFFSQMRTILGVLRGKQSDLKGFLEWAPNHNRNTQRVEYIEFNQVVQDFIICGLNDNPKDPARSCDRGGK